MSVVTLSMPTTDVSNKNPGFTRLNNTTTKNGISENP
jgi:hypothetical protein